MCTAIERIAIVTTSYLIDFDDEERVCKVGVVNKDVSVLNIPAPGNFLEDTGLPAGQRLKGPRVWPLTQFYLVAFAQSRTS